MHYSSIVQLILKSNHGIMLSGLYSAFVQLALKELKSELVHIFYWLTEFIFNIKLYCKFKFMQFCRFCWHKVFTLLSWCAAASPEGPDPTTATFLFVLTAGGSGRIHPCSYAWSMMAHSMFLMVTAGSLIPSTHAPSQGAGQTLPVNSIETQNKLKYYYFTY